MSQVKLGSEIRDRIVNEIGTLLKQQVSLKQTLREQDSQNQSANEELFLELLEVVDALDFLMEYMVNNPDLSPQFIQRLPKSVGSIQKKLLNILGKREVKSIELEGNQLDFEVCKVVDREVRPDQSPQTITKVVRQGFRVNNKLLRPIEVITSKLE
ncbi:nucleotide exchange factor GrpE [Planktothrix mougeotii LEGE 06226]|uniref:Nucleotide exchange factor GrpE n=2 Tax=Planktothrix mougeotii TaxID=54306 RepID=A0ABR9UDA5_9CYAN|nr:nucleotide exchange factor GrpE [Planktothrix mougeotii LEGE 06226]